MTDIPTDNETEPNVFERLHRVTALMYQAAEAAIEMEHTAPGTYRLSCGVRVDEQNRVRIADISLVEL